MRLPAGGFVSVEDAPQRMPRGTVRINEWGVCGFPLPFPQTKGILRE